MAGNTASMPDTPENNMSRRGFLRVAGATALVGTTASAAALTIGKNNVLSPGLNAEVAKFAKEHPEWATEFMPFEQDCIAGIEKDAKECEEGVRWQLADFRDEIKLKKEKAQVNAERAQVNTQLEMTSRLRVVTAVWALNNIIRGVKNPPREALDALSNVKNPVLLEDIAYILQMDRLLASGSKIAQRDVDKLQKILLSRAWEALALYNTFSEEAKQQYINSYTVASQASKFVYR